MLLDLSKSFDVNKADSYFIKLKKDGAKIELKKIEKTRTLNQNNYLHCLLGLYSNNTGYTPDELKMIFSEELPEMLMYEKGGHMFRRSTADLDTKEMTILIDFIRQHSLENMGIYLPDATEYLVEKFNIERDIQNGR